MPWFKVDDKLHDHRKTRACGKSAMGVWVLAGSWCADQLTDGFVPAGVLPRWGTADDAAALVDAGLWHEDTQGGEAGWRFHDWAEFQPTKASIDKSRATKSAAGRKGGKASGKSRREARASSRTEAGASAVVELPTRPDPFPTAAAAAVGAHDAAAAAAVGNTHVNADLPTGIAILRDKLHAVTALQALRFDNLTSDVEQRLLDLINVHGQQRLVDTAVRTLRTPPPVHVVAFLGTWAAMPAPGQRLAVVKAYCDEHPGEELRADGRCLICIANELAGGDR